MNVEFENIEAVRLREGIDDVILRNRVSALAAEDRVRVSISSNGKFFEKVTIRITSRKGERFRGKLTSQPRQEGLSSLIIGSSMQFAGNQIHSIVANKTTPSESPVFRFVVPNNRDDEEMRPTPKFVRPAPPTSSVTVKKSKIKRLRVQLDGRRRFIQVPIDLAKDIHLLLRARGVRSAPPQPYLSDCDCIELDASINVAAVQAVLDNWQHN